jgi:uncharacterized repeat protein (TIGR03803 family)
MQRNVFKLAVLFMASWAISPASAFVLTKVYDFPAVVGEAAQPYSVPVQVGNNLWFTTEKGGDAGFGTLSKWDLTTTSLTTVLSGNNTAGNTPQSFVTPWGGKLFFTTTRGGTGDRGVLASYEISSGNYTVLWNSPSSSPTTNPNTLTGNPVLVDRGTHQEIYFMTRNGGSGAAGFGTIQKYNSATNLVSQVAAFTGAPDGRQPFGGFTQVGSKLFFTTFVGGNTGTGYPNGAGTLMQLDLNSDAVSTLAPLPAGDGSTRFASSNPLFHPEQNALFFVTAGTSLEPGALMKYDLSLDLLTTVYELTGAPTTNGPFPDGRFIYSELALYENSLFFTTIQGGAFGGGTLNRFNLSNNQFEVLFDLGNDTVNLIDWGKESRGGPAIVNYGGQDYLYILTRTGGAHNQGTILALTIPEPSAGALLLLGGGVFYFLRRRATGRKIRPQSQA